MSVSLKIISAVFKAAVGAVVICALAGCISRDNYYDPINYIPVLRQQAQDSTLTRIDSSIAALSIALGMLDSIKAGLVADSLVNALLRRSNDSLRSSNTRLRAINDSVANANNAVPPPATFGLKLSLDTLFFMVLRDTSVTLWALENSIVQEKRRADSLLDEVNRRYAPSVVFSPAQISAILGRYDSLLTAVSLLRGRDVAGYTINVVANRDTIVPYNVAIKLENGGIKTYNDSIAFLSTVRDYVQVSTTDSIMSLLLNAVAGDQFLVGSGIFDVSIRFKNSGTVSQPIIVQGQNDMSTRFNLSNVVLDSNANITFNKIVFFGSPDQSVLVQNGCDDITFRECQFRDNTGRGISIVSSDVSLYDCRVVGNGGDGMVISSAPDRSQSVLLNNVLIANNGGEGIRVTGCNLTVQNATIANHGQQAIYLDDPARDLSVTNSLITNNCGSTGLPAIYFAGGYPGSYPLTVTNTNMAMNAGQGDTVNAPLTSSLLHHDPMYQTAPADDFVISPDSPLSALEQAGIIIGYRKKP